MSATAEKKVKVKKEKKVRVKGTPVQPIKWFLEKADETGQDADKVKAAAVRQEYSPSTISIQLGRLRALGLLPALEKTEKVAKEAKKNTKVKAKAKAPKASKNFHPAPKPSQQEAAA